MNEERSFERFVADNVAGQTQGIPLPDDFYDDMLSFASDTRQRPEWLALIKEPPMRTNSHLAVGSPTVRVAAIMFATLLLAVALAAAGIAGQRLLAADDPIVVAQDGSGDFTTIVEAIGAAVDGDEIAIRPGTYAESLFIDRDITIRGDSDDRSTVVVRLPDDVEPIDVLGNMVRPVIVLEGSAASIGNLTIGGPFGSLQAFVVEGGAPVIHDVTMDLDPMGDEPGPIGFVHALGRAGGEIRDSEVLGLTSIYDGSSPTISGMRPGPDVPGEGLVLDIDGLGSQPLVRDNTIAFAWVTRNAAPTIEANDVDDTTGFAECGLRAENNGAPQIISNRISGFETGICIETPREISIAGNELTGNATGIRLDAVAIRATLDGNTITDGTIGVAVMDGSPVLTSNTICGNDVDVEVADGATPDIDDSNEICEGGATE